MKKYAKGVFMIKTIQHKPAVSLDFSCQVLMSYYIIEGTKLSVTSIFMARGVILTHFDQNNFIGRLAFFFILS